MNREFFQPDTLIKALQLKRDLEGASLLAGGTDFVVTMQKNRGTKENMIDLSKIRELKGIEIMGNRIKIGSMTNFTEILNSVILRNGANILCQAGATIGSTQIRNRGTIGGNICNASAAADGMPPLLCLDAEVELQYITIDDTVNSRILSLEDFMIGTNKTAINDNEIMVGITVENLLPDSLSSFQKIGRRNALAIARINGCCVLRLNNNIVESIQFALGASTSKAERIRIVEDFLTGRELTMEALHKAGKYAAEYVFKQTGTRSSSVYKLPVIEKFTISLIMAAAEKEE